MGAWAPETHFQTQLRLLPLPSGRQKHPRWVYGILFLSKYKMSRPQSPPNERNNERTTRPLLLALLIYIY
jgi:hypothetical protein